jgi:hypothetical protein
VPRTFFAYHLSHVFGPFGLDSYHTNSEKPTEGDHVYVLSGDKDPGAKGVDYFLEGVFKVHRRTLGPWSLRSLGGEAKDYKFKLSMEPLRRPDNPIPLSTAPWYSREDVHRFFTSGQNFNPLPIDPDYKSRFDELLAGFGSDESSRLLEDIATLERDVPDKTMREVLAMARIGQGRFRADLVAAWRKGETCALTGLSIPEMLIASHIRPWRDSTNDERLDPMNGLLLVAHADKLFDRFLMSFQQGRSGFAVVLHPRVRLEVRKLGITEGMLLNTSHLGFSDEERFRRYMSEHLIRHTGRVAGDKPTS